METKNVQLSYYISRPFIYHMKLEMKAWSVLKWLAYPTDYIATGRTDGIMLPRHKSIWHQELQKMRVPGDSSGKLLRLKLLLGYLHCQIFNTDWVLYNYMHVDAIVNKLPYAHAIMVSRMYEHSESRVPYKQLCLWSNLKWSDQIQMVYGPNYIYPHCKSTSNILANGLWEVAVQHVVSAFKLAKQS